MGLCPSAGIGNAFRVSWSANTAPRLAAWRLSRMFPSLLSENMARSHKWCLEMNNKACKDSTEGERRHVLELNLDFLTGCNSDICITPAGSFLSWHKLLRGLLSYIFSFCRLFFHSPSVCHLLHSLICSLLFYFSILVLSATGIITPVNWVSWLVSTKEMLGFSFNSNQFATRDPAFTPSGISSSQF